MLAPALGHASNAWTAATPLPGGDMPDADFEGFLARMRVRYDWLAPTLLHRYARAYGTRMDRMLAGCSRVADLGVEAVETEVVDAVETEVAETTEVAAAEAVETEVAADVDAEEEK